MLIVAAALMTAAPQAEALATLRAHAAATHSDALYVVRDGKVLVDERTPGDPLIEMMSSTKGVVALAVMKAIDEGRIAGLDEPVHRWFPEWKQGRKAAITLRMVMAHTSGLQNVPNAGVEVEAAPDMLQLALAAELDAAPGERFAYNNKATNLLSGIIERATAMKLDAYVKARLLAPLGITAMRWRTDRAGRPQAMAGLQLAAADMAKIGQLVLDRGRWQGRQLIRAELIDTMLAPGAPTSGDTALMWYRTPAWQRYTIDEASLARLRATGLDAAIVDRLRPLLGQTLTSRSALRDALIARIGPDGMPRFTEAMVRSGATVATVFTRSAGPIASFHAEGYLGQVIVVIPEARLVVVRQYRARRDPPLADSYPGIIEDSLAVAAAARTGAVQ